MPERVPAEGFAPGEYVKDFLTDRGWTQEDLATILDRPLQMVNEIILDKRRITPETAKGLSEAFGTSAQLWLNLDSAWQLFKARKTGPDPAISLRAKIYSTGPIQEMVKRGWIAHSSNPEVLEQIVLDFFGKERLEDEPGLPAAARISAPYVPSPSLSAWMCRALQLATTMPVEQHFSEQSLRGVMQDLHALMDQPEDVRRIPTVLAKWGIRFLVLEHLKRTKIDGACLWLDEDSPVIAVSMRYDRIDYFWFTLMHELGHAFNGDGRREAFLAPDEQLVGEGSKKRDEKAEHERRADEFAEEALIPQDKLDDFVLRKGPLFSERDIRGFASLHEVHPGLVIGQLHHRFETYSKLRRFLVKVRDHLTQSALTDGWGHHVPATA